MESDYRDARWLIVSNRLPVTVGLESGEVAITPSTGGLATGIRGTHERHDSLWIGWPGDASRFEAGQRKELEDKLLDLRTVPIHLTQSEIARYYEGFSNSVLWPLFHYMTDKVQREAWMDWETYVSVNRRFAQLVAKCYRSGDVVWVHDYHLCLVPAMFRRIVPEARVGFFLHIPFPSSEVLRILPWREEILEGILGADLVGFHTESYLRHFTRSLRQVLGIDFDGTIVPYRDRESRLGVFPMGIDAVRLSSLATDSDVSNDVENIRATIGDGKLLLGVDRLDHTKGLQRRLLAIERLLEREPSLRNQVRLVQIVAPSRTRVGSYNELRRRLDETVGRINGKYGTVNSVPIHYIYRSASERELAALYRAADVMLVTPLRDGMNLVAKEFVASRVDEDGVLVLSEFAGAAAELIESIQVNPYDLDRTALGIRRALSMPAGERKARMCALRRRVLAVDCYQWASRFVRILQSTPTPPINELLRDSPEGGLSILNDIGRATELILTLDYDGTLVPFAETPDLAVPDEELKRLLLSLAACAHTEVHLLSGRTREALEDWFGDLPIGLHAEHGFWSRYSASLPWVALAMAPLRWKDRILPVLDLFTAETPGSLIEDKTAGVAWHFRMADPESGPAQAKKLLNVLQEQLDGESAEILLGSKVIEIRMSGVHKGVVAKRLSAERSKETRFLAMGDDKTDEDLFAALPEAITIRVGPGSSGANYRLATPADARSFLERLVAIRSEKLNHTATTA